jgi:uncharacterized protein (TIGR02118 family)
MFRVVVSYPNTPGSRFDMDYYLNKHTPLVLEKLKPHGLTDVNVDQGIGGGTPGSPAQYQVQAYLNFPTAEQLQAGMAAAGASLMADLKNFTDVRPDIQISKVIR